jgi:hypothetical protein
MTIDELKREVLQLDPSTRAHLAHELFNSLEDLSETSSVLLARSRAGGCVGLSSAST